MADPSVTRQSLEADLAAYSLSNASPFKTNRVPVPQAYSGNLIQYETVQVPESTYEPPAYNFVHHSTAEANMSMESDLASNEIIQFRNVFNSNEPQIKTLYSGSSTPLTSPVNQKFPLAYTSTGIPVTSERKPSLVKPEDYLPPVPKYGQISAHPYMTQVSTLSS